LDADQQTRTDGLMTWFRKFEMLEFFGLGLKPRGSEADLTISWGANTP